MVPSFCRLELPQPTYRPMSFWNAFCTIFYRCFILKIPVCAIMLGFRKSGHVHPRFQDLMAACMRFLQVVSIGISSCYVLDLQAGRRVGGQAGRRAGGQAESSWHEQANSSRLLATHCSLLYSKQVMFSLAISSTRHFSWFNLSVLFRLTHYSIK